MTLSNYCEYVRSVGSVRSNRNRYGFSASASSEDTVLHTDVRTIAYRKRSRQKCTLRTEEVHTDTVCYYYIHRCFRCFNMVSVPNVYDCSRGRIFYFYKCRYYLVVSDKNLRLTERFNFDVFSSFQILFFFHSKSILKTSASLTTPLPVPDGGGGGLYVAG